MRPPPLHSKSLFSGHGGPRLPLSQLNTDGPSTPRLEERPDRKVTFDPRGSYPQTEGKGATDRRTSVERRLLKKLPAGVPRTAIFVDEHGADMSWRNVSDNEKPPGARGPSHGARKAIDPSRMLIALAR